MNAPEAPAAPALARPADPAAGVIAAVAAINAEISDPVLNHHIRDAIQRLQVNQALATALQDAVADLRAHATIQLAAIGGAATQLLATGDVKRWHETTGTLIAATDRSQQRLAELVALLRDPRTPASGVSTGTTA